MNDPSSIFAMGGYGAYVWPAFAVAAAVLLGLWLVSLWRLREGRRRLAALEARLPSRRARRAGGAEEPA